MALEKVISYDHSVTENGHIEVRQITRIMEDGNEISKAYKRSVVSPGQDTTGMDAVTIALAEARHTPEVIEAYLAKLAAQALDATKP